MANGNTNPGLPGANVFAVIMAAPTDILGLATRQLTETMGVFNLGVQRLGTEIAQPPAIPAGLPALPAGLPPFPFPGMGAPAGYTPAPTEYTPAPAAGISAAKAKPGFII